MVHPVETQVACEVLRDLNIGKFKIKLNHRCILDAMMALCGVPEVRLFAVLGGLSRRLLFVREPRPLLLSVPQYGPDGVFPR